MSDKKLIDLMSVMFEWARENVPSVVEVDKNAEEVGKEKGREWMLQSIDSGIRQYDPSPDIPEDKDVILVLESISGSENALMTVLGSALDKIGRHKLVSMLMKAEAMNVEGMSVEEIRQMYLAPSESWNGFDDVADACASDAA